MRAFISSLSSTSFRSRLHSALRAALACALVSAATLYAPTAVHRHLKYPSFSYVTAVLITAGDPTLGSAIHGAAQALYGSALGLLPAVLALCAVKPEGISAVTAAAAVAVSAFAVAATEAAGLTASRVALGQIVIVYVTAYKEEKGGRATLHPLPVAASTAVGAVASVAALLLPFPRLACFEVREKSKLYTEITMERLKLLVGAVCADNSKDCKAAFMCRAKYLSDTCNKLLQSIKIMQGSMQWELPPLKFFQPHINQPYDSLQAIEIPLRGMEIALSSSTSSPIKNLENHQQHFKKKMLNLRDQISTLNLQESNSNMIAETIQSFNFMSSPKDLHHLPSLFFLFCMNLLRGETLISCPQTLKANSCKKGEPPPPPTSSKKQKAQSVRSMILFKKKLLSALKCSLSLSLAVLFGVLFRRENGCWAGITVAIAFTPTRDSTFRSATSRAHGTALGSIYGVLTSFISQTLMEVRLLALIPWIIFTSFIHHSRIYGQAGASTAAISAMIISGRRNYGSPMIFTIERLTECYVGLFCAIFFELILQPTRAPTAARRQLVECLRILDDRIDSVLMSSAGLREMKENVDELEKYVEEAEIEPNFWFLPFNASCYKRLHGSLYKMLELMIFMCKAMEVLSQEPSHEMGETMRNDLDEFKELIGASLNCMHEVIQVKEFERERSCSDIEEGLGQEKISDEKEVEKVVASFVQHSMEVLEGINDGELKNKLVICFGAIGFCVEGLMREVREMEKGTLDLLQWENPSREVNLYEIYCKIKHNKKVPYYRRTRPSVLCKKRRNSVG